MTVPVPPLEHEEIEHFNWLIDGLLRGAEHLTERPSAVRAIRTARDLFADLIVRVEEEVAAK